MSKTPQERYDEIKREIIQISESYTRINNMDISIGKMKHINFLHYRLRELIQELKTMKSSDVEISLVYKKMVNQLMLDLGNCKSADYRNNLKKAEQAKGEIVWFVDITL